MVAVFLAGEDVAKVHFDGWRRHGGEGVVKGDAGVAVATGVDDDAIGAETDLVYAVDDFAFDVALVVAYLHFGEALSQLVEVLLHSDGAVDFGLAAAGKVQIGTVDDFDVFHNKITSKLLIYCI